MLAVIDVDRNVHASGEDLLTNVRRACLLLSFAVGIPVCAQYKGFGIAGDISTRSLDDMQNGLRLGNSQQRADFFVHLGIDASTAKVLTQAPSDRGVIRPIRGSTPEHLAILFVPGVVSNSCYLYLLQQAASEAKSSWHAIDHQELDSWDGTVSLEIAPLRNTGEDDIILRHVNETHGTVFVEGETQVYSVFSGKLVRPRDERFSQRRSARRRWEAAHRRVAKHFSAPPRLCLGRDAHPLCERQPHQDRTPPVALV